MRLSVLLWPVLAVFFLSIWNTSTQDADVVEVFSLIKSALGVAKFVSELWNEEMSNSTGVSLPGINVDIKASMLLTRFNQVARRLGHMENNIASVRKTLRDIQQEIPSTVRWELTVETMENLLRPINSNYNRFLHYQLYHDKVEPATLIDFAQHAVSHDPQSLQSTMVNLHHLAKGLGMQQLRHRRVQRYAFKQGLFRQLHRVLTTSETKICDLNQSQQQLAYSLYAIISITLAKAYSMIQFSYMLLRSFEHGNFTVESRLATQTYDRLSLDIAEEAQHVIKQLSGEYWRCDPDRYQSGVTYDQVTQLLQGYMENEVDLNADGTCNNNCAYYKHTRREGCYLVGSVGGVDSDTANSSRPSEKRNFMLCDQQRPCLGGLHACRFYDSDSRVCMSPNHTVQQRRYDWIEFEDGQTLGRVGKCNSHKVDSWWRNLFWHCSYCLCLCDDPTFSDRYFSLIPEVADAKDNMVVTGVRWVKKKQVFYLQIQQGRAEQFGFVNSSSVHWKPLTQTINIKTAIPNRDYTVLSYETRSIDLDDLVAPDSHVITGVSLRKLGEHINLKVQVSPIAARTAQLYPDQSYWLSNDSTPAPPTNKSQKRRLRLTHHEGTDVPTNNPGVNKPDVGRARGPDGALSPAYMQFGPTSMRLDVAQTTVPFFDTQPVAPNPAVWLTGLGIYHKGASGYGGFLGLRVRTVDLGSRVASGANGGPDGTDGVIEYESRQPNHIQLLDDSHSIEV